MNVPGHEDIYIYHRPLKLSIITAMYCIHLELVIVKQHSNIFCIPMRNMCAKLNGIPQPSWLGAETALFFCFFWFDPRVCLIATFHIHELKEGRAHVLCQESCQCTKSLRSYGLRRLMNCPCLMGLERIPHEFHLLHITSAPCFIPGSTASSRCKLVICFLNRRSCSPIYR